MATTDLYSFLFDLLITTFFMIIIISGKKRMSDWLLRYRQKVYILGTGKARERLIRRNQKIQYKNGVPAWLAENKQERNSTYKKRNSRTFLKNYNGTMSMISGNKIYRKIKKEMDRAFIAHQNYIKLDPKGILSCPNLVKNRMDTKYKHRCTD
jgi:hypothetical protein